ncbi:hypothetical protein WHI96_26285 [Pseudonocardia tropica]|uniref:Uncharacterized protein n=1 Tax=Pseudonocardia tropica TaxID=681289 RepID=A0ABV1K265_9PSEU
MENSTFEILSTDPVTQVPEPVRITTAALRDALLKNPALLVGALHEVLEKRFNPNLATAEAPVTLDTPISGLIADVDFQRLSSAARRLTRGDLMSLAGWGDTVKKSPEELGLDVEDIQLIRDIFGKQLGSELGLSFLDNISCCSCTPCCCAAAVTPPARALA